MFRFLVFIIFTCLTVFVSSCSTVGDFFIGHCDKTYVRDTKDFLIVNSSDKINYSTLSECQTKCNDFITEKTKLKPSDLEVQPFAITSMVAPFVIDLILDSGEKIISSEKEKSTVLTVLKNSRLIYKTGNGYSVHPKGKQVIYFHYLKFDKKNGEMFEKYILQPEVLKKEIYDLCLKSNKDEIERELIIIKSKLDDIQRDKNNNKVKLENLIKSYIVKEKYKLEFGGTCHKNEHARLQLDESEIKECSVKVVGGWSWWPNHWPVGIFHGIYRWFKDDSYEVKIYSTIEMELIYKGKLYAAEPITFSRKFDAKMLANKSFVSEKIFSKYIPFPYIKDELPLAINIVFKHGQTNETHSKLLSKAEESYKGSRDNFDKDLRGFIED